MSGPDPKADLQHYLQLGREALAWKLDGLSEYEVRRPLVPARHQPSRTPEARSERRGGLNRRGLPAPFPTLGLPASFPGALARARR